MYYKGTLIQCQNYNATVTAGENYQGPITTKWADPIEILGEFFIAANPNYSGAPMVQVATLPEDPNQ